MTAADVLKNQYQTLCASGTFAFESAVSLCMERGAIEVREVTLLDWP